MPTDQLAMPRVQHQGPASHCKVDGHKLGWVSCTAYSMAMGIDAYTAGDQHPKGCAIRKHTGDTESGLTIRQVAEVAQEHYDVLVTRRTGSNVIAPEKAAELAGKGRGFVLQGNTGALLGTKSQSTKGPVQHAVWVQRVEFDANGRPAFAVVFDPCADGRRLSSTRDAPKAPQKWPWDRVLAFASALQLGEGRELGPGRFYAGFVPRLRPSPVPGSANLIQDVPDVTLRFDARKTAPFPDRTRAKPPAGRRVNVRRRPDRLDPDDVTDKLGDGDLFIAYQRTSTGAKPPGSRSRTWFGNRDGTAWVHVSGLRHVGGST
jgi:hypothetical protein